MTEILKLIAELKDSNNAILAATRGTGELSDAQIGDINNNACDVAYFLGRIEVIVQARADAGKCMQQV